MASLFDLADGPGREPSPAGQLPLRDRRASQLLQTFGYPRELSRVEPRLGLPLVGLKVAYFLHRNQHGELHS